MPHRLVGCFSNTVSDESTRVSQTMDVEIRAIGGKNSFHHLYDIDHRPLRTILMIAAARLYRSSGKSNDVRGIHRAMLTLNSTLHQALSSSRRVQHRT